MRLFFMFYMILYATFAFSSSTCIDVTTDTHNLSVLERSQIYFDTDKKEKDAIITSPQLFQDTHAKAFSLGVMRSKVWIKLHLCNKTDKPVNKILLFKNTTLEHIYLYDNQGKLLGKTGVIAAVKNKKTFFPYVPVKLEPNTQQTFYVALYNTCNQLSFSLFLDDEKQYLDSDYQRQIINATLLGIIIALAIYSIIMGFYLKDLSYFFYASYLIILVYTMIIYLNFAPTFFQKSFILFNLDHMTFRIYILAFATAFFAISFLKIWKHPLLYNIYKLFLLVGLICIIFFHSISPMNLNISLLYSSTIIIYNFIVGVIIYHKGYSEARFYIIGFGLVLLSYLVMISDSLGLSYITLYFPNLILWTTIVEALALSLAFADRYIIIQKKLYFEIDHKKEQVEEEVTKKTEEISQMLQIKEVLLQELHHRVKNSLYIIISIIQLQKKGAVDTNEFQELENRIFAISKSYDILYHKNNFKFIDMHIYLNELIAYINHSIGREKNVRIDIDVDANIALNQAIYIGLIVNELVTNAFKYAFPKDKKGIIDIKLKEEENHYILQIKDNGIGFKYAPKKINKKLGIHLVKTLVKEQLKGHISIDAHYGTSIQITLPVA